MNTLVNILDQSVSRNRQNYDKCTPSFFRLNNQAEAEQLGKLLLEKPEIQVSDTMLSQLKELIRTMSPGRPVSPEDTAKLIEAKLNGLHEAAYGVWVYYPWSERLVHILDKEEFVELRTNRNKYKITNEERDTLAGKKIGVIGLSVGQSVSLTLAMERGFGELRIADFDELEITNLNRLRSGIHNMGLKKTILVAREIAEIDPFLKVVCYHEGITPDNMDAFLTENGKLDILIDECDTVDIKILCRIAAKKFEIPVLMEASDRGTVDIERFDLEPTRSVLHGYIDHLDITKVKDLKTSEEKIPYMLPISGVETLSARMKASALEVGSTIVTWPQLASAVTFGGGVTADICRRILLDEHHQSGRFFLDLEELIGDPVVEKDFGSTEKPLTKDTMMAMLAGMNTTASYQPEEPVIKDIVTAASLAPSAGNNQPWKWLYEEGVLSLFHDMHRSQSFGDFRDMAAQMALGAALENLTLTAAEQNLDAAIKLYPKQGERKLVAQVTFTKNEAAPKESIAQYIGIRNTNRKKTGGEPMPAETFEAFSKAVAGIPGAEFMHVEGAENLAAMADVIGTAERMRALMPAGHHELFEKEIRWNAEEAEQTKDGLDLRTFELGIMEQFGMRLARDPKVGQLMYDWNAGKGLERITRRNVMAASAIGLITMPEHNDANCIMAGRALERLWLTAAAKNVAMQPMMAPILYFARVLANEAQDMPVDLRDKFLLLYKDFSRIFSLAENLKAPLFLFRMGYADTPELKSYRLNTEDVLFML